MSLQIKPYDCTVCFQSRCPIIFPFCIQKVNKSLSLNLLGSFSCPGENGKSYISISFFNPGGQVQEGNTHYIWSLEAVEKKEHLECSTYQTAQNPQASGVLNGANFSKCLGYPQQQRQQALVSQTQGEHIFLSGALPGLTCDCTSSYVRLSSSSAALKNV